MKILAIETSCDETAIAIIEVPTPRLKVRGRDPDRSVGTKGTLKNPQFKVLSNITLSQAKLHAKYGGVFPTLAKREHSKNLVPVLKEALKQAEIFQPTTNNQQPTTKRKIEKILEREPELLEQFLEFIPKIKPAKIDLIAVTYGPGLEPALWVGINFAKALSEIWNIPVIPVNHMEGHIASILPLQNGRIFNFQFSIFKKITFPAVALLISGGHTELVLVRKWGDYKILGQTRDDAVGEVYDKVARMLNLPYPGGPEISRLAQKSRNSKTINYQLSTTNFPRPMIDSPDLDFSFSGLKTAVLYHLQKQPAKTLRQKQEIAREFEDAVAEVLIAKTKKALEKTNAKTLIIAGGVSANKFLREEFQKKFGQRVDVLIPPFGLSTDNALMIAMAGYLKIANNKKEKKFRIKAEGNLTFN